MLYSNFLVTSNFYPPKKANRSTFPLSKSQNNANSDIYFKSCNFVTTVDKGLVVGTNIGLKFIKADHETYFYRHPDVIKRACYELKKRFPQGCTILNPFCGIGEESRTYAAFLGDAYDILGIDISPDVINLANQGKHTVRIKPHIYQYEENGPNVVDYPPDGFLLLSDDLLTEEQRLFRENFLKSFDIVSQNTNEMTIQAKTGAFKTLKFMQGNIESIAETAKNIVAETKKTIGAVIAQNGLYHISKNNKFLRKNSVLGLSRENDCSWASFEKAIKDIYEALDEDGIFVYGSLDRDHLTLEDVETLNNPFNLMMLDQNGRLYYFSKIHEILAKNNFYPIHWSTLSTPNRFINSEGKEEACWLSTLDIKVPSIFKKIN